MRLSIRLLGCEVLVINTTSATDEDTKRGDATAAPTAVGFTNIYAGHSEEDR